MLAPHFLRFFFLCLSSCILSCLRVCPTQGDPPPLPPPPPPPLIPPPFPPPLPPPHLAPGLLFFSRSSFFPGLQSVCVDLRNCSTSLQRQCSACSTAPTRSPIFSSSSSSSSSPPASPTPLARLFSCLFSSVSVWILKCLLCSPSLARLPSPAQWPCPSLPSPISTARSCVMISESHIYRRRILSRPACPSPL